MLRIDQNRPRIATRERPVGHFLERVVSHTCQQIPAFHHHHPWLHYPVVWECFDIVLSVPRPEFNWYHRNKNATSHQRGHNNQRLLWGNFWSMFYNRVGRRPFFLIGMTSMFCAFLVLTILTGINQGQQFSSDTMGRATVAMIFIFGILYKMPAPMVDSYIAEVSPYELRASCKGICPPAVRRFRCQSVQCIRESNCPCGYSVEVLHRLVLCFDQQLPHYFLLLSGNQEAVLGGSRPDGRWGRTNQMVVDEEAAERNEKLRSEFVVKDTRSVEE